MLRDLLVDHIRDPGASWACGRFGAIAEFHRDPEEPVEIATGQAIEASTSRGAIRLNVLPELRPVAYETISSCIESWGQGVALCLPRERAAMSGRAVVTELGPDRDAVRPLDRDAILFDLGLGGEQADICVRSADPEAIALLRAACGAPLLQNNALVHRLPALSPHRVFCCRMGRIEVYQPIPAPDGKSPEGPHTHVLPRLLAHGRLNAATVPVPEGWLAGMSLFPAHPLLRADGQPTAFDADRYHAFQSLMQQFGDPDLVAGKQAAFTGAQAEIADSDERRHALGFRIGQRQRKWLQEPIAATS
ncbi:DUF6925 family protein [Reyranella soli]|uniref:Uncharacterized protein n=1 Tax=Reyranella soli TaxID=1230389 RepID=A0A512NC24_9HYPH|nr:hypothetical protein RSO01_36590 [Reyranella soli]